MPPVGGEGPLLDVPAGASTVRGGRRAALQRLSQLPLSYATTRDLPTVQTTGLGAHNHFGTVSIREVYDAVRGQAELVRQLYWRDFYAHICDAFEALYGSSPYAFTGRGTWARDADAQRAFDAWCAGRTGRDMVDAGMRELAATGHMHNRLRMICASYLVKDLGVDWRWGEGWYARHLVDYDFAQNFGNWAWIASVLPFSQVPFRRHNPDRAALRFDPNRFYRSRWLKSESDPNDAKAQERPLKKPKID